MLEPDVYVQAVTFDFRGRRGCLAYFAGADDPASVWVDDNILVVTADSGELAQCLEDAGVEIKVETETVFSEDETHIDIEVPPLPAGPLDTATAHRLWDGWSLLDDIAYSIGRPLNFRGPGADRLLLKLFYGLNLEVMTPVGESYHPTFRRDEQRKFHQMISAGHERLAAALPEGWVTSGSRKLEVLMVQNTEGRMRD